MASYGFEFYSTGTISVIAGMTAFTGTGTAWQVRGCEGALLAITGANAVNFVASLSSDNAGELRMPWAGATMADAQYTMWLPSAAAATNLANHQRLAEIIASIQNAQPASDVLDNIALLPVGEDKLLIGDDSGQYVLIDRSELGIDDPHANLAQLAALAKANDQFVIMGANGIITLMSIKDLTDAIAEKYKLPAGGTSGQFINGLGQLAAMNKAAVGLGNVDNTSDANKPVSTAQQSALNGKANLSGATFTGNVVVSLSWLTSRVNNLGNDDGLVWQVRNANDDQRWSLFMDRMSNGLEFLAFGAYGASGWMSNPLIMRRDGSVTISGTLSKGAGTFLIDHPLDPANKNLRHGFVEAPEYVNIYRGTVRLLNGKASINIDDYFGMTTGTFAALNADIMVSSLQNQEGFSRIRPVGEITDGTINIICEDETCNDEVTWMVTGRRKDAFVRNTDENCERGSGKFIPEFDKED